MLLRCFWSKSCFQLVQFNLLYITPLCHMPSKARWAENKSGSVIMFVNRRYVAWVCHIAVDMIILLPVFLLIYFRRSYNHGQCKDPHEADAMVQDLQISIVAILELNIEELASVSSPLCPGKLEKQKPNFTFTPLTTDPILPAWVTLIYNLLNKQLLLCRNNTAAAIWLHRKARGELDILWKSLCTKVRWLKEGERLTGLSEGGLSFTESIWIFIIES